MGKTVSRSSSNKFSVYDFTDEDEELEKTEKAMLKKFTSKKRKNSSNSSPLSKYNFLQCFLNGNVDQYKESALEPIDVDAGVDVLEGCHSGLETTPTISSLDYKSDAQTCSHDHNSEDLVSGGKLKTVMDPKVVVTSASSNRDDIRHHDLFNDHMSVVVFPDHILLGQVVLKKPRLTFSCCYIKLEGSNIIGSTGPLSIEWTIADIVKIGSQWFEKLTLGVLLLQLKSKDTKVTKNVKYSDEGIIELRCEFNEVDWPKTEDKIRELDARYKDTWNTGSHIDAARIEDVFMGEFSNHLYSDWDMPFEEVTYPKGDDDAISIGKRDIQLLRPETFINDTIIDFYMKYLKSKVKHEQVHRFHIFNSFFFQKLADLDKDIASAPEGKEAFQRVRKWTRNVNIFEKDYIFIPVNFSLHWSLVVICHPGEVINLKEEEMENLHKVPCILHMNSIKGSHRGLQNLFQSYLWEEWKERHNELVEYASLRFQNLLYLEPELPQQENSFDCGLFLLHYTELFMEKAPLNFNPFRIPKSSSFLRKNWFCPAEASLKRDHIKELIRKIAEDNSASDEGGFESSEVDKNDNAVQILHRPMNKFCVVDSSFPAYKECDTTPLAVKPLRSLQCYGEPRLILDVTLHPGDHARSLTDGNCKSKKFLSPVEECEEAEDQTSAIPQCAKELKATESSPLLPGNSVCCDKVEKREHVLGTTGICEPEIPLETQLSGGCKTELLNSDTKEDEDIYEFSSTSSDEFETCVVEDSEEVIETQDDNERQSLHLEEVSDSSDEEVNSATVTLPTNQMPTKIEPCVVDDSEEELPETPCINVNASPKQEDFTEIADSTSTPLISVTNHRNAKRERAMLIEEEEPRRKKFQTILID